MKTIIVPTDFSDCTDKALRQTVKKLTISQTNIVKNL